MGVERALIVRSGEGHHVANVEFHAPAGFDLRLEED